MRVSAAIPWGRPPGNPRETHGYGRGFGSKLFRSDMLYLFNMVWPCSCVRKVWLFSSLTHDSDMFTDPLFIVCGHAMTWAGSGRFRPVRGRCHVHLAEHSTRSVVLLNVSLHRVDESQVARNSCPRLPRSILGLVSIMSLSC